MNRHLTDEQVLDLLAPGAEPGPEIVEHLDRCPECRARLDAEGPLSERLAALPREVDPPRDHWPDVRERIATRSTSGGATRSTWRRPALRAAAAVAIFVLGAVAGRSLPSDGRETAARPPGDPLGEAAAVQRAGTDYVAAVARFRAVASESSSPVVDQARDVALAAAYGAAWELSRLRPDDATAREIVATIGERRLAPEAP